MKNYLRELRALVGNQEIMINCAALWVENQNGVLLERRGDDGRWGLIGGVMELGEGPREAALREFKEETGLDAVLGELIGVYSKNRHQYPNGDRAQPIVFFFHCSVDPSAKLVLSDESLELRYFPREQLPDLGMPQHRSMAADALAGKRAFIE